MKKKGRTWYGPIAGNAKLKGKASRVMPCGCCVFYNRKKFPKDSELEKNFRILEEGPRK